MARSQFCRTKQRWHWVRLLTYVGLLFALAGSEGLSSLAALSPTGPAAVVSPMVDVIVQGVLDDGLAALIEAYGGQVMRELTVIDALVARLPADRIASLEREAQVIRVWQDAAVRSSDSADPGVFHVPVSGGAAERAGFDLNKVIALDGDKANLDDIPASAISPYVFQAYTFQLSLDPAKMPQGVGLRFVFKEKELNHARLEVHQASTGTWHPLEIDTGVSEDEWIDVTFDLSEILVTAEDLAEVQVRF